MSYSGRVIQAMKRTFGAGQYMADTGLVLRNIWSASKAAAWGTLRGRPFQALEQFEPRVHRMGFWGRHRGFQRTWKGGLKPSGPALMRGYQGHIDMQRSIGQLGAMGLGAYGAYNVLGGESLWGTAVGTAGFAGGYGWATRGMAGGRGVRGIGAGAIGAFLARGILG